MLRFFRCKQKKEETSSAFLRNGSALQEELIASFNGRQEIPIRSFTAKELITATNNFADKVALTYSGDMYSGSTSERQILVKRSGNEESDSRIFYKVRDIAISSQMSHLKNVLKLSGCCLEFQHPALVYEYVEFEQLDNLLRHCRQNDNILPWRNRIKIAIGIANAILYLHTAFGRPIIYRDLCPSNVIIDRNGVAKFFDFSLSISLPHGESQVEDGIKGTVGFIDPEYFASSFVTQKTDVYGFGLLLLVLITGEHQCKNSDAVTIHIADYVKDHIENDQLSQIIDRNIIKDGFDQQQQVRAILDLALRCSRKRGEDRPEMIDVARELRQIART